MCIRDRLATVRAGEIDLLIGTHALLTEGVEFRRLGLVVIDEQHRFGVRQRALLRDKGSAPHLLVMTATPIPRTLALTLFGELDVSILDELPPGRTPPITRMFAGPRSLAGARAALAQLVEAGRSAFVVCPQVEAGAREVSDVEATAADLRKRLPGRMIGVAADHAGRRAAPQLGSQLGVGGEVGIAAEQLLGELARALERPCELSGQAREAQPRRTRLAQTKQLAVTALGEVALGDLEAVAGVDQHLEARGGLGAGRGGGVQQADRGLAGHGLGPPASRWWRRIRGLVADLSRFWAQTPAPPPPCSAAPPHMDDRGGQVHAGCCAATAVAREHLIHDLTLLRRPRRRARAAPTMDSMEMERERGISPSKREESGPVGATILLQKWSPDAPYLDRLRRAAPDRLYHVYHEERPDYARSTAFFLDVADVFFDRNEPALALRVLSNLAEMELENPAILRILGYRLLQAGVVERLREFLVDRDRDHDLRRRLLT